MQAIPVPITRILEDYAAVLIKFVADRDLKSAISSLRVLQKEADQWEIPISILEPGLQAIQMLQANEVEHENA